MEIEAVLHRLKKSEVVTGFLADVWQSAAKVSELSN